MPHFCSEKSPISDHPDPPLSNRTAGIMSLREHSDDEAPVEPVTTAQQGRRPPWVRQLRNLSPNRGDLPHRHNGEVDENVDKLQLRHHCMDHGTCRWTTTDASTTLSTSWAINSNFEASTVFDTVTTSTWRAHNGHANYAQELHLWKKHHQHDEDIDHLVDVLQEESLSLERQDNRDVPLLHKSEATTRRLTVTAALQDDVLRCLDHGTRRWTTTGTSSILSKSCTCEHE